MKWTALVLIAAIIGCANTTPMPVEPVSPSEEPEPVASASAAPVASEPTPAATSAAAEPDKPPAPKFPAVEGVLEGKPFEIKGAATAGPVGKDGTVLIVLASYQMDCSEHDNVEGDRTIGLTVPWKSGATADLAKLGTKGVYASRVGPGGKLANIKGFKPSGSVEVLGAPGEAGRTGRISFDVKSGNDEVAGEVPVKVCF